MAYVILSRIQSLSQLYIIDSIPFDKIKPWPSAIEELERMKTLEMKIQSREEYTLKLVSLNTLSLREHIDDVKGDFELMDSHVICLQETWLNAKEETFTRYDFPDHNVIFNSVGRGKGIATLYPDEFTFVEDVKHCDFQMTRIESSSFSIINVYRSAQASSSFITCLIRQIDLEKNVIICGDLNFCALEQQEHEISKNLNSLGFIQLVKDVTHREGRSLDHVYFYHKDSTFEVSCKTRGCYYSDHDQVELLVKCGTEEKEEESDFNV